jgi:hypothetical protein
MAVLPATNVAFLPHLDVWRDHDDTLRYWDDDVRFRSHDAHVEDSMPKVMTRLSPGLRKGGTNKGAGRPRVTPEDRQVKKICKKLILNPEYQQVIKRKMLDCTLHPSVQILLWYYAYGKPKETVETKQITPVRIEHVYADLTPKE